MIQELDKLMREMAVGMVRVAKAYRGLSLRVLSIEQELDRLRKRNKGFRLDPDDFTEALDGKNSNTTGCPGCRKGS
jgi:hypothetical protein